MSGKAKNIITVILVLVAAGVAAGYYFWNKPHQDVADTAGVKTDAIGLYKAFSADSVSAKKKYIQQVVEVSGIVNSISKNQQKQIVVQIKSGNEGAFINCTMEGKSDNIKEGNPIVVKGICDGIGQGDADLGIMGDVYLVRCYLVK